MNKQLLKGIIIFGLFGSFIFIKILIENQAYTNICQEVFRKKYYFIVKEKNILKHSHDTRQLICLNILNDSNFIFYPSITPSIDGIPKDGIFKLTEIGDTVYKEKNSYEFLIKNKNLKPSFIFDCMN